MRASFPKQMQILNMRRVLVYDDEQSIINKMHNRFDYTLFLEQLTSLELFELGFILLDPGFIPKIRSVLHSIRFKTTEEKVINTINSHITTLNLLENKSDEEKKICVRNYMEGQELLHKTIFLNQSVCATSLANDGLILTSLINESPTELTDIQLYTSVNYFLEVLPELFSNEKLRDHTVKRLTNIRQSSKNIFQKKLIKQTIIQIDDIKDKN